MNEAKEEEEEGLDIMDKANKLKTLNSVMFALEPFHEYDVREPNYNDFQTVMFTQLVLKRIRKMANRSQEYVAL